MTAGRTWVPVGVVVVLLASCATPDSGLYSGGSWRITDPHSGNGYEDLANCRDIYPSGAYLAASPAGARPGTTVEVRHSIGFGPGPRYNIPLRCVSRWQVDPPGAATLSDNRRFLQISPDAAPGLPVTLTATANGELARITVPVIDPDVPNLLGNWLPLERQACNGRDLPRELSIRPDGRILAAFEGTMAYWGDEYGYSFDPATGVFVMGNQTGRVTMETAGRIVFTGLAFPSMTVRPPPPPYEEQEAVDPASCTVIYQRTGPQY